MALLLAERFRQLTVVSLALIAHLLLLTPQYEGETRQEALEMARDAIVGYLETRRELGRPVPRGEHERVTIRLA